ncbi:hypothetical protein DPEC_G00356800 [Dallia pectoralis]|uniref:Uncharacterized protein n=1 Tax=Dallia pectoralis TaxID=75939 RepID=A0ACC2EZV3_DALPE|nr:hypothetical protein DPEC_G00356800 [Dallia pectoralis]
MFNIRCSRVNLRRTALPYFKITSLGFEFNFLGRLFLCPRCDRFVAGRHKCGYPSCTSATVGSRVLSYGQRRVTDGAHDRRVPQGTGRHGAGVWPV